MIAETAKINPQFTYSLWAPSVIQTNQKWKLLTKFERKSFFAFDRSTLLLRSTVLIQRKEAPSMWAMVALTSLALGDVTQLGCSRKGR